MESERGARKEVLGEEEEAGVAVRLANLKRRLKSWS